MKNVSFRFAFLALVFTQIAVAAPTCEKPWLFFDLGLNTLLDTSHTHPKSGEMVDVQWMPGAHAYLTKLKALGYKIGLLVDVPENWGGTDAKALKKTQDYIADAWIESQPEGMDWSVFTEGLMFFPPKNKYRKKAGSTYLFDKAVDLAAQEGCTTLHQATRLGEVELAKKAGMMTYQAGVAGRAYYLPIAEIQKLSK